MSHQPNLPDGGRNSSNKITLPKLSFNDLLSSASNEKILIQDTYK
jgi:hypothetical protein